MARIKKEVKQEKTVRCSNCMWFIRDTEGISIRNDTHEYFMGKCRKGLHPDGPKKVFADHERICQTYIEMK